MTTISDGSGRQNKRGLTFYRSRLIARAKTLAEDKEFREVIRRFRRGWNIKFYRFQIRPVETFAELQSQLTSGKVELCTFPEGLTPPQLGSSEEHEVLKEWETQITEICTRFWPDKIFGVDGRPASTLWHPHPAFLFVTACVFCDTMNVQGHADWFFANFAPTVKTLPYQPILMDRYDKLALHGERHFWKSIAREALKGSGFDDDALSKVDQIATQFGRDFVEVEGENLGLAHHDNPDSPNWFHYIPVNSMLSTQDFKKANKSIVEQIKTRIGTNNLDKLIRELAEDHPQDEVAKSSGISIDTVRKAVEMSTDTDS